MLLVMVRNPIPLMIRRVASRNVLEADRLDFLGSFACRPPLPLALSTSTVISPLPSRSGASIRSGSLASGVG